MQKSLWNMFVTIVSKHGNRPVFHLNKYNSIKYHDMYLTTLKYRNLLKTYNVKKGDNILVVGKNTPNWASLMYSINSIGAVIVPTFEEQQPHITSHVINETKPVLIFNSTGKSISKTLQEINHETIVFDNLNCNDNEPDLDQNATSMILYTSGTSGFPKGVPLTNLNVMSNIDSLNMCAQKGFDDVVTYDDKFVSFLPWNHCYGLNCELNYMISNGASMYKNNNLEQLRKDIVMHNPTILCSVPRLFQLMYKKVSWVDKCPSLLSGPVRNIVKKQLFGKKLRYSTVGGSAISTDLLDFFSNMGVKIYQGYGTTECSPMISLTNSTEFKKGSVGKILDCNSVMIHTPTNEVLVNGSNVMSHYFGYNETESFAIINGKRWYKTGDTGHIKDDYLFLTGRIKEQYKLSNGKFVNPVDVENVLLTIPEIQQVVVFGKDADSNSAIIVTDSDEHTIRTQIKLIEQQLKKYEIPQKLILTKIPFTTENGMLTQKKSQKREVIINKYTLIQ